MKFRSLSNTGITRFRSGTVNVAIAASSLQGILLNNTISPALDDTTLTNWLIFCSFDVATIQQVPLAGIYAHITSTTKFDVRIGRFYLSTISITQGSVDFTAETTDLAGVADAAEPHQHGLSTLGPAFGNGATSGVGGQAVAPSTNPTYAVNWLIIHK